MKKSEHDEKAMSGKDYSDDPYDAFDLVNKYGTYNIQPTASTDNEYPKIAQGIKKDK